MALLLPAIMLVTQPERVFSGILTAARFPRQVFLAMILWLSPLTAASWSCTSTNTRMLTAKKKGLRRAAARR